MAFTSSYDWKNSLVGPIEKWPQSLKNAVSMILQNGMPMYLVWGKELTQFYNDGYDMGIYSLVYFSSAGQREKALPIFQAWSS